MKLDSFLCYNNHTNNMIMKFDSVDELVTHSFNNPIPVDVKIGNEFASVKIYKGGGMYVDKYIPEKFFTTDKDVDIEKYVSETIPEEFAPNQKIVISVNSSICRVSRVSIHTVLAFVVSPVFEFVSEYEMKKDINKIIKSTYGDQ